MSLGACGPYTLEALLGSGTSAEVFSARSGAGTRVALKRLRAQRADNPVARTRFSREARAVARLEHPNIVQVLGVGDGPPPWLALEFVDGPSLAERLLDGPLPEREWWELALPLIDALRTAHSAGIVHRDVKPANVLLGASGPKLTDFGISRVLDELDERETRDEDLLGTPAYMAPEQRLSARRAGAAADQYALATTLWEAATGELPSPEDAGDPRLRVLSRARSERPDARFGDVSALALALLRVAPAETWTKWAPRLTEGRGGTEDEVSSLEQPTLAMPPSSPRRWRRAGWAIAPLLALSLLGVRALRRPAPAPTPQAAAAASPPPPIVSLASSTGPTAPAPSLSQSKDVPPSPSSSAGKLDHTFPRVTAALSGTPSTPSAAPSPAAVNAAPSSSTPQIPHPVPLGDNGAPILE